MKYRSTEDDSLALIAELHRFLAEARDSIAGKTTEAEVSYLIWGTSHVNKLVSGYYELRSRHLIHASKIMIRPMIETIAAVVAAIKQPGFLFQKACSEYGEDKNLLTEFRKLLETSKQPTAAVDQQLVALEKDWDQFKQRWNRPHPAGQKSAKKLRFPDVLHAAGLDAWYAQYRIYCQFTHGALRATTGDLDEMTDPADDLVVAWLTLILLDQLRERAPVKLPDLRPFWHRAECLMKQTEWK